MASEIATVGARGDETWHRATVIETTGPKSAIAARTRAVLSRGGVGPAPPPRDPVLTTPPKSHPPPGREGKEETKGEKGAVGKKGKQRREKGAEVSRRI